MGGSLYTDDGKPTKRKIMKGFKHCFIRDCKKYGAKIKVGNLWQCKDNEIIVPIQDSNFRIFIGFHELAHHVIHSDDKRNYDDLKTRIDIEIEADTWANNKMTEYGFKTELNHATLGLIALHLYRGGKYPSYSVTHDNSFIVLYKLGFEIFGQFTNNLPMHPCIY